MANRDELNLFVRDALVAGKSRDEIASVLTGAGWSPSEVNDALGAWDETPFSPPVPRPVSTVSARDFFVYALTFGLLLIGSFNLVLVLQALVDLAFADESYGETEIIRWGVSVLIVTAPLYLWLTLRERRKLAQDPALYRSAIRKWLTYLALLFAAMTLLIVLIATVYALLTGDLTGQFIAKALIVVVVAGGIFLFYFSDIGRGEPQ
jgi:hypothetical protein